MKNNKLLGTLLGDSYIGKNHDKYSFRSQHAPQQEDLLNDIAEELRKEYKKHVSVYFRRNRNIYELYLFDPSIAADRAKFYPNDKKNLPAILNEITNPELAVAYWLADDGCIHYATDMSKRIHRSPKILLATCNESLEDQELLIKWLKKQLGVDATVTIQKNHKRNKSWPLLKFDVGNSYRLWMKVRHHILHLPSMKHKFRILEQEYRSDFYRKKYTHERPTSQVDEDVCRASEE
jgi:hypothetical protein